MKYKKKQKTLFGNGWRNEKKLTEKNCLNCKYEPDWSEFIEKNIQDLMVIANGK